MNRGVLAAIIALSGAFSPPTAFAGAGPIVAVFDIEDRGAGLAPQNRTNLTDYLCAKLAEGGYQVIPRNEIRERLAGMKKESYKECYDQSCQIELGRELAAQKSIATRILKIGTKCQLTVEMFDLKKNAAEGGATVSADCSEDGLLNAVNEVARKLCQRLRPEAAVAESAAKQPPAAEDQGPPVDLGGLYGNAGVGIVRLLSVSGDFNPKEFDLAISAQIGYEFGFGLRVFLTQSIQDHSTVSPDDQEAYLVQNRVGLGTGYIFDWGNLRLVPSISFEATRAFVDTFGSATLSQQAEEAFGMSNKDKWVFGFTPALDISYALSRYLDAGARVTFPAAITSQGGWIGVTGEFFLGMPGRGNHEPSDFYSSVWFWPTALVAIAAMGLCSYALSEVYLGGRGK